MNKYDSETIVLGVLTVVIILVALAFGLGKPYFEAKSFNNCTGGNASYMTALTTELRVENCNQSK